MKAYTSLEQSKKLAKILPLDSADMYYAYDIPYAIPYKNGIGTEKPCWSLAALLELMPFQIIEDNKRYGFKQYKGYNSQGETYCFEYVSNIGTTLYETYHLNNPIDAAFEMVCWLLENKKIQ